MKAVIMAGGEGTRLRPLTSSRPKPMLPVANRPIMEHVIRLLARHGFDDIVVTIGYRGEAVRRFFGDGSELGVRLAYASEEAPLGTAGSVRNAMAALDEACLVISGDVLTDADLSELVRFHRDAASEATVALQVRQDPVDFGIVIADAEGAVQRFLEKPTWGQVFSDTVNTGIYVLEPTVFDAIAPDRAVDFAGEVFPLLLEQRRRVYGCAVAGYWEDIGTLEAYNRVHRDLLAGRVDLDLPGFPLAGGACLGEGAEIDPTVRITGPVVVGPDCTVEAGAWLGADTFLGSNVRVSVDASIERCVIHDNVYLGPGVHLRGAVVGRGSRVRRGATLEEGVVLGDDCVVGERAVIEAGVSVYPSKTVEAGAVVSSSIVWESRRARSLFGSLGVSGLANVDVTPEVSTALAMAFATTVPRGSSLVVSRDTSRAGRMLKRAVIAGVNAAGVNVIDLEVATVPVTRFAIGARGSEGGITVRLAPDDPQSAVLRFFDAAGGDIGVAARKRIERIYERRDARRAVAGELGEATTGGPIAEDYTAAVTAIGDVAAVRFQRRKVVLDYSYGAASFVMPTVLAKLGADVLAVNPYASTGQAIGFGRAEHTAEVARLVVASGADLGAVIDADGERISFVDDLGHVLSDDEALIVLLGLVLGEGVVSDEDTTVILPVSVRSAAVDLCAARRARLVLTGLGRAELLHAAREPGVVFASGSDGGYVFPRFLPAVDAVAALVSTLALLAASRSRFSDLVAAVVPSGFARREVAVPFDRTGHVMRTLLADLGPADLVITDGVKVTHEDGWALVAPDPDAARLHVLAEAGSDIAAAERAEHYAALVRAVLTRPVDEPSRPASPVGDDSTMFSA